MPVAIPKPQLPDWADPAQASVFDYPGQGLLRKVVGLMGLDDPNQVMGIAGNIDAGPSGGGALEAIAGKFPRFAKAIKAFHGSPHDFDQFKTDAIGTGEGAQAYGHGLYFAENEGTARAYREALAPMNATDSRVNALLQKHGNDLPGALDEFMQGVYDTPKAKAKMRASLEQAYQSRPPGGKMYEVQIHADPDHFLDWDKPFAQQSPKVQRAIEQLWTEKGGSLEGRTLPPFAAHSGGTTGDSIHSAIATTYGKGGDNATAQAAASAALKDKGVPGIKYLDQGSRAAGEGSRNYVVFDDKLVDILKKYGLAGAAIDTLRRTASAQGGTLTKAQIDGAQQ